MLRNAAQLRGLANGGMSTKKYNQQADWMERAASTSNPKETFANLMRTKGK